MSNEQLNLIRVIREKGGTVEIAESLLKSNPTLATFTLEELERHLFLIMNNDVCYAVLFIMNNDLFWSIVDHNECHKLIRGDHNSLDYVIHLMLESISKYEALNPHHKRNSLEEAINQYKLVKKNEKSYHIK